MKVHDIDLSFVEPARRDEVARRIAILLKYLEAPSRAAAIRGAEEIGVGLVAFYNIAKAWRRSPRAENMAGSRRPRTKRSSMTVDQLAVVDAAVARAPEMDGERLVELAFSLAAETGVELPARWVVRVRVDRMKPPHMPASAVTEGADLVLDECVVDIPVLHAGSAVRPLCTVLFDVGMMKGLGMHLSLGTPTPRAAAAAILDALGGPGSPTRQRSEASLIDLHVGEGDDWNAFTRTLTDGGMRVTSRRLTSRSSGKVLLGVYGNTPGVRFKPRLLLLEDRPCAMWKGQLPMSLSQADEMLRGRFALPGHRNGSTVNRFTRNRRLARALSRYALADTPPE